jgi:SAM-dependent methyltransferase
MGAAASHRECPVCGALDAVPVYRQRFAVEDDGSRIAGYDVVVCRPCGAVYADGIPSQKALDAYYRDSSKYEYLEEQGEPPEWLTRWHTGLVGSLMPYLASTDAKIVDVGCGNGDVLGMLKAAGYERVLGVDLALGSPEAARRLHGVRVLAGGVMTLPEEADGADCIILSAVLEHLRDVRDALTAVAAALAPDGLLYAEVPDLERFPTQIVPPFQEFSLEHVNFFTAASLRNAAAPAGLDLTAHWNAVTQVGTSAETSLCALFKHSAPYTGLVTQDTTGQAALRRYVASCADCEEEVAVRIEELVDARTPVIVWGLGTHALHLLESTSLRRANIVALVDANPRLHGLRVGERSVAGPESVASRSEALLICSPLHQDEIVRMARERFAMSNPVLTLYGPPPQVAVVIEPGQRRTGDRP